MPDPEPLRNQYNYRITEADKVGVGSLKQKCRANLTAIEWLKKLEAQQRPATEAEQQILVRYVGWGGLPQVFDAWNEQWKEERERLEALLTEDELDSARATTLNAHYTAPVVSRLYKDKEDDQWKSTDSFGRDDLLVLAKVADAAHTWIFAQTQEKEADPQA